MTPHWQERLGSLLAGGGVVWAVYIGMQDPEFYDLLFSKGFTKIFLKTGPMELCAAGILIWITAKWRRSISLR